MNRDDAIKAVAEHLRSTYGASTVAWLDDARSLADAGLLAIDPEPDAKAGGLPIGTRKRSPKGVEAILTNDGDGLPWIVYKGGAMIAGDWLHDGQVANWEIIPDAPEGHVTIDMSRYKDWVIDGWTERMDPLGDAARAELARRGESE